MFNSHVWKYRLLTVSLLFLLTANSSNRTDAADFSWVGNDGNWSDPIHWVPFGVPSPADVALLGNLPGVEDSIVTLDQNDTVSGLVITELMRLDTNGNSMVVNGDTAIDGGVGIFGSSSGISIQQGSIFTTVNLTLSDGGSVFVNGGRLDVTETLAIDADSTVFGDDASTIRLFESSGPSLVNDGELLGRFDGGLIIDQISTGRIDLDGATGNGSVLADRTNIPGTAHSTLTINGDELHDEFNGTMRFHHGGTINMNLSNGWTMGSGSSLRFSGEQSQLNGSEVTLSSEVRVIPQGQGRINANAILTNTANVEVSAEGDLEFHGEIEIDGGQFTLSEDAKLEFVSPTTLEGGTFITHSNLGVDGFVNFNGETDWDGNVTINGIARQNGDADVVGPTTIQAGVLDMDGGGGTIWNVGSGLVINAAGVDSTISNSFDGVLNVGGGFAPKLTINLSDPADHWTMAGEMNLSNLGFVPFPVARVAGSLMRVTGQLNVSHLVGITAPTTFDNNSETNLLANTDRLTMSGPTTVRPGAMFNGVGTLVNVSDAGMTLEDGVSLDDVRLINGGLLEIGDSPGVASVDRFENTDAGTWLVEIGGHIAGTEHDLLIVTDGIAQLDGFLNVDLIDAGVGLFLPEVGDQFTVLTSLGDVSGAFTNDPVSFAAGQQFHWDVVYDPHNVILELANITVPEPMSLMLLVCGITVCGWHLRCRRSDGRLVCRRC